LLRPDANKRGVEFRVVESKTEQGLGFDPAGLSKAGNAVCRVCGTVAGDDYVKAEGLAGRLGMQLMATAAVQRGTSGKAYLQASSSDGDQIQEIAARRLDALASRSGMTVPSEAIVVDGKKTCWSPLYGLTTFADLFTTRQLLCLMTFADLVKKAHHEMIDRGYEQSAATAVATYLGLMVDKLADYNSTLCLWNFTGGRGVKNSFPRPGIPVTWDFCETNPFNPFGASWVAISDDVPAAIEMCTLSSPGDAYVTRGSATQLSLDDESIDVVVTDPPYYDNVAYANVSDFFYVWLKRSIGFLHPEHFAGETTPKKAEAIADASRHEGGKQRAREAYQAMMAAAFREAHRVLKEDGQMCVVYAHKTTLGWSALVDALRSTGFVVTEAWPIETEKPGRLRDQNSASLASSIFLSTRKRERGHVGSYEQAARPELHQIVQERVSTLWALGVTGADLVIAAVGAGLRAFTSYDRVEYANGDEVSTEQFLAEVEAAVLETLLEKIFGYAGLSVGAVDGATRFYTLWRYAYGISELDAGEAIVFTYSQPVELDGPNGLSAGTRPLVGKKATKYRLLDFSERGANEKLGLSDGAGRAAPLIDILHRVLWLSENDPRHIATFLDEAQPDLEQLRVIAQALAGAGLKGGADADGGNILVTTSAEQSALSKLTAGPNWRSLTHQPTRQDLGPLFAEASSA
jgi:putative DNA methylase